MTGFKILSLNTRGLGAQFKRRDVMNYLKQLKFDIAFLQDTHLVERKLSAFNALWNGKTYNSCFASNSRGCSILIHRSLSHEVLFESYDENGNYVLVGCKIGAESFLLLNIYGPNKDDPSFYEHIDELLMKFQTDNVIIGGDFNFVINPEIDSFNYSRENNINAKQTFLSSCRTHDLVDVWRLKNPDRREYTWLRPTPLKGGRLDMFFASQHLLQRCIDIKITPGYKSDHNMVMLSVGSDTRKRGPGLWKFNDSLLGDEDYISTVNQCIQNTVEQYALPIYNSSYLVNDSNYKNIEFVIHDDLFYETLLLMIRGETVAYAKRKAKRLRAHEKELIAKVNKAHSSFVDTQSETDEIALRAASEELEKARKPKIDGLIVRSRTAWHEEGERNSAYFLGLEKRNAIRNSVSMLKIEDQQITNVNAILQALSSELERKYSVKKRTPTDVDEYLRQNCLKKLSIEDKERLEKPISFEELTMSLKTMKKGKSPGSNGYTSCFFKQFWDKIGPFLYRGFLCASQREQMMLSHNEAIVKMIPKTGKPLDNVRSWRPISLLNVDFKIVSAAVASRLRTIMSDLIEPAQTAFLKGRYIGENIRLVYDVLEYAKCHDKSGILMSADFEAAFDSVSWEYLEKALNQYNFGPDFRHLIKTMYLNSNNFARIDMNGFLGEKVFLECGIRQGDPASGYLFNLAVNLLTNQIAQSEKIAGVRLVKDVEVRISQYADDTVLFLDSTPDSVRGSLYELQRFSEMSGLKLNVEKTSCMMFGSEGWCTHRNNFGLKWVQEMKILGVVFSQDLRNIAEINLRPKLIQIQKEIVQWRRRHLTPFGKITVIKSLLISKIVHLFLALPNPTAETLKEMERMFYKFIWDGKRDSIKRTRLTQGYANGGLCMIEMKTFLNSLKLSWLRRLFLSQSVWAKLSEAEIGGVQTVLNSGIHQLQKIIPQTSNPFWVDVIKALVSFLQCYSPSVKEILSESMWYSDHTKFRDKMIRTWDKKGLRFIYDLFDNATGVLHTKESLEKHFNVKVTFLCFESLLRSLPLPVRQCKVANLPYPVIPWVIQTVLSKSNFGRFAYKIMIEKSLSSVQPSIERLRQKWSRDIGIDIENNFIEVIDATSSTRLKYFHFRIVNRIISTNAFLNKIAISDDDSCSFCHREVETIVHLFWHCRKVQEFVQQINQELFTNNNDINTQDINISPKSWFFPCDTTPLQALIITLAKIVIHESRMRGSLPSMAFLKNKLRYEAEIELFRSRTLGQERHVEAKWDPIKHFLYS